VAAGGRSAVGPAGVDGGEEDSVSSGGEGYGRRRAGVVVAASGEVVGAGPLHVRTVPGADGVEGYEVVRRL